MVDGALWVGVADAGARHRGGTLRLEYTVKVSWKDLDPSTSYSAVGYELLGAHERRADRVPAPGRGRRRHARSRISPLRCRPRPRVAVAMPSGCGAASGIPPGSRCARATSASRSSARCATMPAAPGLFASIRGARACTPKRCDLSRGIVADDAAGTVVFRLTEPDGDLLTKLALPFAAVLPPSVGVAAPAKRALPATGPYTITEIEPGRFVRLERNPRFKSWSRAARPDGYPDAITARLGAKGKAAVDRVLTGRADRIQVDTLAGTAAQAAAPRAGAAARIGHPRHLLLRPQHAARPVRQPRRAARRRLRVRPPGGGHRGGRPRRRAGELPDPAAELPRQPPVLPLHRLGRGARAVPTSHERAGWCGGRAPTGCA